MGAESDHEMMTQPAPMAAELLAYAAELQRASGLRVPSDGLNTTDASDASVLSPGSPPRTTTSQANRTWASPRLEKLADDLRRNRSPSQSLKDEEKEPPCLTQREQMRLLSACAFPRVSQALGEISSPDQEASRRTR